MICRDWVPACMYHLLLYRMHLIIRCGIICSYLYVSRGCGWVLLVNWPSGLRRQFKALVRKGVGSNPTLASCCFPLSLDLSSTLMLIKGVIHYEMYPRTVVSVNRFVLTSGRLLHPGSSLQRKLLPMSTFTSLYLDVHLTGIPLTQMRCA